MAVDGWRHFVLVLISVLLLLKLNWIQHIHATRLSGNPNVYGNLLFQQIVSDATMPGGGGGSTDGGALPDDTGEFQYAVMSPKCDNPGNEFGTSSCRAARWAYYIAYACAVDLVVMTAMHASFMTSRTAKMVACAVSFLASIMVVVMMSVAGRAYNDIPANEIEPDAYIYGTVMVLLFGAHAGLYVTADGGSSSGLVETFLGG